MKNIELRKAIGSKHSIRIESNSTTEEDSYREGVIGGGTWWDNETVTGFYEDSELEKAIVEEFKDYVKEVLNADYDTDFESFDFSIEENVVFSRLVDNNNIEASKSEIELWKQEKKRLWIEDIFIKVFVNGKLISSDIILKLIKENKDTEKSNEAE